MTDDALRHIEAVTPAWRELEAKAPVKLRAVTSERHYRAMVEFMNELLDDVSDRESHPLSGLLDIVTTFVHDYEEASVKLPDATPSGVLRSPISPICSALNPTSARF